MELQELLDAADDALLAKGKGKNQSFKSYTNYARVCPKAIMRVYRCDPKNRFDMINGIDAVDERLHSSSS